MKTIFALWILAGIALAMAASAEAIDGGYLWRRGDWIVVAGRRGIVSTYVGRYSSWFSHDVALFFEYPNFGKLELWNRRIYWGRDGVHYVNFRTGLPT